MPIALDPEERFEVTLETDAGKPEATRPAFCFRYQTYRQWRKSAALADEREKLLAESNAPDFIGRSEDIIGRMLAVLVNQISGWRNIPVEFAPDALDAACTRSEIVELFYSAMRQNRLTVTEKNVSESPSPIATDVSVTGGATTAATSQPS